MVLATLPFAGMAQEAADSTERDEATARDVVEERVIIVEGSRFQKLLESSQSKAVITAEQRNLAGIGSTRQFLDTQPGFNFTEDFGINVRGVGRQTAQTLLG
jgi:iron complex outermembrane receptor protein